MQGLSKKIQRINRTSIDDMVQRYGFRTSDKVNIVSDLQTIQSFIENTPTTSQIFV